MNQFLLAVILYLAASVHSMADNYRWIKLVNPQFAGVPLYNNGTLLAAINFSTNPIRSGFYDAANPNPEVIVNQIAFQTAAASAGGISGTHFEIPAGAAVVAGSGNVDYASARNLHGLAYDAILTDDASPGFIVNLRNLSLGRSYRANFIFSSALPKVHAYFTQAQADADPLGQSSSLVFGSEAGPAALDVEFAATSTTKSITLFANSPQRPLTLAGFTLFDVTDTNPPPAQRGIAPDAVIGQLMEGSFPTAPKAICLDPVSGKLFVSFNTSIWRFSSAAKFLNGALPEIKLSGQSEGLAIDTQGNLWAAQNNKHRVIKFASAANRTTTAPEGFLGLPGNVSGAGKQGLRTPKAVAVDVSGTLWVADSGNNRVLGFINAHSKADSAEADYLLGQPTWDNIGSGISPTRMSTPHALAAGPGNALWVADGTTRILRFDIPASASMGGAAQGVLGHADFFGTLPVDAAARFYPRSISCTIEGRLYVKQPGLTVLRFDSAAGKSNGANPDASFTLPSPLLVDNSVPCFTTGDDNQGWFAGTIEGNRSVVVRIADLTQQSGPTLAASVLGDTTIQKASAGKTKLVSGVCVDPAGGKVFAVDQPNNRILRFKTGSSLQSGEAAEAVFGQPDLHSTISGTSPNSMKNPSTCHVDALGNLWVSDSGNRRVLRFSGAAAAASGEPADGVLGQADFLSSSTRPQSEFSIVLPGPLISDTDGRLWVADLNPAGPRILRFDSAAQLPPGAAANGVLGRVDFYDTGLVGPGAVNSLTDLAIDPEGSLWAVYGMDLSRMVSKLVRFDNPGLKANGAPADHETSIHLPALVGADIIYSYSQPFAEAPSLAFHEDGRLFLAFAAGSYSFANNSEDYQIFTVSLAHPRNLPASINSRVPYATSKVIKIGDPLVYSLSNQKPGDLAFSGPNQFLVSLKTGYFSRYSFPEESYSQWLQLGGYVPDPGVDPDQDGLSNLMEYYLAGNPAVPDSVRLPVVGEQAINVDGRPRTRRTLTFTCRAGIDDVTPIVETSTRLTTGGWEKDAVLQSVEPAGSGLETRVYLLPDSAPRLMARLRLGLKQ